MNLSYIDLSRPRQNFMKIFGAVFVIQTIYIEIYKNCSFKGILQTTTTNIIILVYGPVYQSLYD